MDDAGESQLDPDDQRIELAAVGAGRLHAATGKGSAGPMSSSGGSGFPELRDRTELARNFIEPAPRLFLSNRGDPDSAGRSLCVS